MEVKHSIGATIPYRTRFNNEKDVEIIFVK